MPVAEAEKIVFAPQPGPQEDFLSTDADIAIYGGSRGGGKTYALLLEPLRHIKIPRFSAVIFRRTFPQILQEGGLWDTSEQLYPYAGATGSRGTLKWKFPLPNYEGVYTTVTFYHMEDEKDRFNWLGASIPLICFDELATFTSDQFFFMLSSSRSTCGVRPYIRATTNPDNRSWVARFISWWWDETTGYPIAERSGKHRYFVRYKDSIEWADNPQVLRETYPGTVPKSVTFIASNVYDNRILLDKDPGYLSNLLALPLVDRERFLKGNWKIDSAGGIMFRREWFRTIPEPPNGIREYCRFWDLAATEPTDGKDPDWTCGVLMGGKDGVWYIIDVQRFRGRPQIVEQKIREYAQLDPNGTRIRMEQEPGSAGLSLVDHYARHILPGWNFKGIASRRNKVIRAAPLSAAAEAGNVVLIRNPLWNMNFLDEAENFRGEGEKNDQIDAATGALEELKAALGDWKFAKPVNVSQYDRIIPTRTDFYERIGTL